MRRVIIFVSDGYPARSPAALQCSEMLCVSCALAGHQVELVCQSMTSDRIVHMATQGVKVSCPGDFRTYTVFSIGRILKERPEFVVLYGMAADFFLIGVFARLFSQLIFVNGDVTDSVPGISILQFLKLKIIDFQDWLLSRSSSVILLGGSIVLEDIYRMRHPKARILRFWPPCERDQPESADTTSVHLSLPNAKTNIVIGYAGLFSSLEGSFVMIEALRLLSRRYKNIKLRVVGNYKAYDNLLSAQVDYQNLITKLGLEDFISLEGQIPRSQIPKFLSSCDLLIVPKISHIKNQVASPIKLGEYLLSGKPVVCSAVAGLENLLSDEMHVKFVQPDSSSSLAAGIAWTIENAAEAQSMGRNGAIFARNNMGIEACANVWNNVFES